MAQYSSLLPVGLLLWARHEPARRRLPVIHVPEAAALTTLGVLLIAAGIRDLIVLGGGLPMNAFLRPPRAHPDLSMGS